MTPPENQIYLASRSPRRQELLKQIGVKFEVLSLREASSRIPDIDETPLAEEVPLDYVRRIARAKAETGWLRTGERGLPPRPVLGADTAVVLKGAIFGKPENPDHAKEMLRALSGQAHRVVTSLVAKGATKRVATQSRELRQSLSRIFPVVIVVSSDCLYSRQRSCWKSLV